ncbi:MAG TPA: hypothetical protein VN914_14365, partial [Polyangia bacterium]|nr:hypothetical protein [Polyangia bacterium]
DFPSNSLAVDNSFIYYVDRDPMGNIGIRKRTAVDPPALAMIINFPAGTGFPRQIAVTADRLLWVGTGIFSSPLDPPTKIPPSPLATGSPTRFAIDGNTLFWGEFASASSGRIYSCPITGCRGSPTVIAATCGVGFLAVDATSVYWICGAMGTVMKVAR